MLFHEFKYYISIYIISYLFRTCVKDALIAHKYDPGHPLLCLLCPVPCPWPISLN
jgi:hypothetical protein